MDKFQTPSLTSDESVLFSQKDNAASTLPLKQRAFAYSKKIYELANSVKKGESLYSKPKAYFRLYADGTFQMIYVVDLRYSRFEWQKTARQKTLNPKTGKPCRFQVKKLPRRHGKTHNEVSDMSEGLLDVKLPHPIGAFYCVDKEQAVRNTWRTFEKVVLPIPGAAMHRASKEIKIPSPTVNNPENEITIYFFGLRGGSGTKRGNYYDIVVMDEVEFIDIEFVETVGMGSGLDRDGQVRLLGTPHKQGRLDHWIDKAKKRVSMRKAIENGAVVEKKDVFPDLYDWSYSEGTAYTMKVYSKERMAVFESIFDKETFNREFLCKDDTMASGFYHRDALEKSEQAGRVSALVGYDPNLPLRVYFDLGIGMKSNRMAFGIFQFLADGIRILYGQDVLSKGYVQACHALRTCKYGMFDFIEVVLPPDAKASEQSDAVPKYSKFAKALEEQGIQTQVRVLPPTTDKLMDIDMVTSTLPRIYVHSIDAAPIVEALRFFCRKWNKQDMCWMGDPSKSKYNDRADVVRHAVTDYANGMYAVGGNRGRVSGKVNGDDDRWVGVGAHPTTGSVCLNPDGTVLGQNMGRGDNQYGKGGSNQKRVFFRPG